MNFKHVASLSLTYYNKHKNSCVELEHSDDALPSAECTCSEIKKQEFMGNVVLTPATIKIGFKQHIYI